MNLSANTKLVQQQRLILTQDLQLFLKLIHMNTLELKEYLEEQLIENPALEEIPEQDKESNDDSEIKDDFDLSELIHTNSNYTADDRPHSSDHASEVEEDNPWENRVSLPKSLLEHLRWQLEMLDLPGDDKDIASVIIGNINEDGYLEASIEDIADTYIREHSGSADNGINKSDITSEVKRVLENMHGLLDPPGVGARSLQECLKIQVRELGYDPDCLLNGIIDNNLEELGRQDFETIAEEFNTNTDKIKRLADIVSRLEPKPGRPFYSRDAQKHIIPDFFLYKVGNDYQLQLNRDFPKIRISRYYRNLINKQKQLSNETRKYLKEKIEAAQRILKCMEEREQVVRKVVENVVMFQKDYFEHGEKYLKPLRLKDIAEVVEVHESTVSRITSNRYIQTPSGVILLKSLFTRGLDTNSGDQVSFERVKSMIREIINNESSQTPFSDEDISRILKRKNVNIARRTVAKYRKILKIPSSSKRIKKGD